MLEGMTDEKWIRATNSNRITPRETQEDKINLEILTNILERCKNTGIDKQISLTKIQWDCMYKCLDDAGTYGYYFKTEYWNERTKFFDIDPYWRNLHSLYKYIDLFKSGAPSSQEQWMQCVKGVCDCSEEEILKYPSVISPPTISEDEWYRCAEVGFIGYDTDYLCSVCDKPINQFDQGDHKVYPTMTCFGCNKGLEPHNIRWRILLNTEQRQYMLYALRRLIHEYEQREDEQCVDEQCDGKCKIREALELKLIKNARHELKSSVSKKVLFDPYTAVILRHQCDVYIKADERKKLLRTTSNLSQGFHMVS